MWISHYTNIYIYTFNMHTIWIRMYFQRLKLNKRTTFFNVVCLRICTINNSILYLMDHHYHRHWQCSICNWYVRQHFRTLAMTRAVIIIGVKLIQLNFLINSFEYWLILAKLDQWKGWLKMVLLLQQMSVCKLSFSQKGSKRNQYCRTNQVQMICYFNTIFC